MAAQCAPQGTAGRASCVQRPLAATPDLELLGGLTPPRLRPWRHSGQVPRLDGPSASACSSAVPEEGPRVVLEPKRRLGHNSGFGNRGRYTMTLAAASNLETISRAFILKVR